MRFLVLAPHPDDDILGCGGWMHSLQTEGRNRIKVVFITSGNLGGDPAQRESEARAGLETLGISDCDFWRYPDGKLPENAALGERIAKLVRDWLPDSIALPSPFEIHPDHRRLTRVTLHHLTQQWRGDLLFYETVQPMTQPNHWVPIDLDVKLRALNHHASQLRQYDYVRNTTALANLRGIALGVPAAEGFVAFYWDGSAQNFFTDRPLVSVIIRSNDVGFLAIAIASLEAQIYDPLEVVIVWHGATEQPLPQLDTWLRHRVVRGAGGRSANLNKGLECVQGRYLVFLDQDDVLLPEHIATLVAEMDAPSAPDLVHARYQINLCERVGNTVQVRSKGKPEGKNRPVHSLLIENHIPIHSYLIDAKTARSLRFDETLDAYEDWDFLIRFALSGAQLHFCDELLCEYRIYPESEAENDLATYHARKGFVAQAQRVQAKLASTLLAQAHEPLRSTAFRLLHQYDNQQEKITNLRQQIQTLEHDLAAQKARTEQLEHEQKLHQAAINGTNGAQNGVHFDVVIPVYNTVPEFLEACIASIQNQLYPHWTLWLIDDGSTTPIAYPQHPAIRMHHCAQNGGIVTATNIGVALGNAPWLVFVDHDDVLHPHALSELAMVIQTHVHSHQNLDLIYTDSRTIDRTGAPLTTQHKPDWSPETLWHFNYINHLCAIRRTAWDAVGGLRLEANGSQDWDVVLRVAHRSGDNVAHIPRVLYDWRVSEHSVSYRSSVKPYTIQAAIRIVQSLLEKTLGVPLHTEASQERGGLLHTWKVPPQPLTVVIPTHDNVEDLAPLLRFLHGLPRDDVFITLVANNVRSSRNPVMLELLAHWETMPRVRVLHHDRPFNWSELNNLACQTGIHPVDTPQILFLNDDIELLSPDTIDQLQAHLAFDEKIGAVGALLNYPESEGGSIQHDGVLTGFEWVARNIAHVDDCSAIRIPRNVAAVTGACLLTRRAAWEAVGGFETDLAVSFNDVDYCLKLREHGWRIVQASDVVAIHRESRTRGELDSQSKRDQITAEVQWMQERWGDALTDRCSARETDRYRGSLIMHVGE